MSELKVETPEQYQNFAWLGDCTTKIIKYNDKEFECQWNVVSDSLRRALIDGRFVVATDVDELSYLSFQNKISRYSTHVLQVTVLLTYACNLRCVYCYEKDAPEKNTIKITDDTSKKLVHFIKERLENGTKEVCVTWYGGEPMLCFNELCALSKKIIQLCEQHGAKYSAIMYSNGVLLNADKAIVLKEIGVQNVQTTLDGIEEFHNKSRPLAGGGGSFRQILNNIKNICGTLHVLVRCNVDKNNIESIRSLIDLLKNEKLEKQIELYFAPVHGVMADGGGKNCADKSFCRNSFSFKKFAPIEFELNSYAISKGFNKLRLPTARLSACMADKLNGFVIEPNGDIQKCWELVGHKTHSIGNLTDGIVLDKNALRWYNFDPFSIKQCCNCKVLPLCMGWCPARIMLAEPEEKCRMLKYNIVRFLKKYYENVNLTS